MTEEQKQHYSTTIVDAINKGFKSGVYNLNEGSAIIAALGALGFAQNGKPEAEEQKEADEKPDLEASQN
jgi:hypothetical protein